jgi:PAS domain S-box-containing protein
MAQLASHRTHLKKHPDVSARNETILFDALLGLMTSCAVIADENANILYLRGEVERYFKFPQGVIKDSLNLLDVARQDIRCVLQSMLHKYTKEGRPITSKKIALDDEGQGVLIKIAPVQKGAAVNHRLVVFLPVEPPAPDSRRNLSPDEINQERIRELEQDLEVTREHLQDTIEELETSSEELQSLNEELQSANEELQASNEELETSNEELQASNEDLNTVSDELRAKSEEAAELLKDFKASEKRYRLLVDNMNEAAMLCEVEHGPKNQPTDLIIRQANRALTQLIAINDHELPLRAGTAGLDELVAGQMLNQFVDIANGGAPQRYEVRLNAIEKDLFGYSHDEVIGKDVRILIPETDSSGESLKGLVEDIGAHPELYRNYVNENICRDGRRVWMTWATKPIQDECGAVAEILAVGTDITERVQAEQALQKSAPDNFKPCPWD